MTAASPSPATLSRHLSRRLLRGAHGRILMDYYRRLLPRMAVPRDPNAWERSTTDIRRTLIANVFLRGHRPGILRRPPRIQWCGVIERGRGYRIRKLRYEGSPGMWIPALLYEPDRLRGKIPIVLNPNGHHLGGKAMDYKQARCINLAKRGMLALNTEFIGMGELQGSLEHQDQAHVDLCGVAGVGVFYLAMKRGLDVLLAHKHADRKRVAMTGLSGGGWQTAVLSALDPRIGVIVPVAGHSPVWQRATEWWRDMGDLEQTPVDLCTIADYDTLTAMFAPRPALLIYNAKDTIFLPALMRRSLLKPAQKVYRHLGAEERLGFYVNHDPGDHNYDRDNREQLYRFLRDAWEMDFPVTDLPCDDEILSEWELQVGLPPDNPTFLSIAAELAGSLPRVRASRATARADRARLKDVLRLPPVRRAESEKAGASRKSGSATIRHHILNLDRWRVPITEFAVRRKDPPILILNDAGRSAAGWQAAPALETGHRVFVADLFGFGEQVVSSTRKQTAEPHTHGCFMACVSCAGDRPLGISTSQLLATLAWLRAYTKSRQIEVAAAGLSTSLLALCAAALRPAGIRSLNIDLPDSLRRLIDWRVSFNDHPLAFCFGLLEQFDIEDLITLAHPIPIEMRHRGPMRARQSAQDGKGRPGH